MAGGTARFKVGADVRSWTEYEVRDATAEEIEVLSREDDESTALAQRMDEAGRLTWIDIDYDDNPDIFAEYAETALLDFELVTEEETDG